MRLFYVVTLFQRSKAVCSYIFASSKWALRRIGVELVPESVLVLLDVKAELVLGSTVCAARPAPVLLVRDFDALATEVRIRRMALTGMVHRARSGRGVPAGLASVCLRRPCKIPCHLSCCRRHVERENSSVESILSFGGVCRFTTNFRNWRKKIRDVKKCRK